MYENGKMRPVETILKVGEGELRRMMEGVTLRYIVGIFVYVTMYTLCNNNMLIKTQYKK
jgi:hypothetical protein